MKLIEVRNTVKSRAGRCPWRCWSAEMIRLSDGTIGGTAFSVPVVPYRRVGRMNGQYYGDPSHGQPYYQPPVMMPHHYQYGQTNPDYQLPLNPYGSVASHQMQAPSGTFMPSYPPVTSMYPQTAPVPSLPQLSCFNTDTHQYSSNNSLQEHNLKLPGPFLHQHPEPLASPSPHTPSPGLTPPNPPAPAPPHSQALAPPNPPAPASQYSHAFSPPNSHAPSSTPPAPAPPHSYDPIPPTSHAFSSPNSHAPPSTPPAHAPPHSHGPTSPTSHAPPHSHGPAQPTSHAPPHSHDPTPPTSHAPPHSHNPTPPNSHAPPHSHDPTPPTSHAPPHSHNPAPPNSHAPPHSHDPTPPTSHAPPHSHGPTPPPSHAPPHSHDPTPTTSHAPTFTPPISAAAAAPPATPLAPPAPACPTPPAPPPKAIPPPTEPMEVPLPATPPKFRPPSPEAKPVPAVEHQQSTPPLPLTRAKIEDNFKTPSPTIAQPTRRHSLRISRPPPPPIPPPSLSPRPRPKPKPKLANYKPGKAKRFIIPDNDSLDWTGITSEDYVYMPREKKYCCNKCDYASPRLDKLVQHLHAHIAGRFKCDICGKAFIKACDQMRHANAHIHQRHRSGKGGSRNTYDITPQPKLNLNEVLTNPENTKHFKIHKNSAFISPHTNNSPQPPTAPLSSNKMMYGQQCFKKQSSPRSSAFSAPHMNYACGRVNTALYDVGETVSEGGMLGLLFNDYPYDPGDLALGSLTSGSSTDQSCPNPGESYRASNTEGAGQRQFSNGCDTNTTFPVTATNINQQVVQSQIEIQMSDSLNDVRRANSSQYKSGMHERPAGESMLNRDEVKQSNSKTPRATVYSSHASSPRKSQTSDEIKFHNRSVSEEPLVIQPIADHESQLDPEGAGYNVENPYSSAVTMGGSHLRHMAEAVSQGNSPDNYRQTEGLTSCLSIQTSPDDSDLVQETGADGRSNFRVNASSILADMNQPFEIKPLEDFSETPPPYPLETPPYPGSASHEVTASQSHPRASVEAIKSFLNAKSPHLTVSPGSQPHFASKQNHVCHLCNYSTKNAWHLEKHLLAHTKLSHTCSYCGKAFERSSDLARHEERHNSLKVRGGDPYGPLSSPPDTPLTPSPTSTSSPITPTSPKDTIICSSCGAQFADQGQLEDHQLNNHIGTVMRVDDYTSNVLTGTRLVECELGENNVITLHFGAVDVAKAVEEGRAIPSVSTAACGKSILDEMKEKDIPDESLLYERAMKIFREEAGVKRPVLGEGVYVPMDSVNDYGEDNVPLLSVGAPYVPGGGLDMPPIRSLLTSRHPGHLRSAASNNIFNCHKCNYSTNLEAHLEEHLRAHDGRYVCKICGKAFLKAADLTRHWVGHETIPGSPYVACDTCSFISIDKKTMDVHMRNHYRMLPQVNMIAELGGSNPSSNSPPSVSQVQSGLSVPFNYCRHCKLGFAEKHELDDHMISVHSRPSQAIQSDPSAVPEGVLGSTESQKMAGFNLVVKNRPKLKCRSCSREFATSFQRKQHEAFHKRASTGLFHTWRYKRPGKSTPRHEEEEEGASTGAEHVCKYCDKSFVLLGNLKNHMKFHFGLKGLPSNEPAECHICGKEFSSGYYLKQHIHLHNGITPYSCKKCGARFALLYRLGRHSKTCEGNLPQAS